MASRREVAVFIDTNMGTRIALPLSPNVTPSLFKRELEMAHLSCFPEMGEIRVVGLKVRRKSTFYHLPESMLLGHVFQDPRENRFIRMDLRPLNDLDGPALAKREAINVLDQINNKIFARKSPERKNVITNNDKDSTRIKRKKNKVVRDSRVSENVADGSKKENLVKNEESVINGIEQFGYTEPVHEHEQEKGNLSSCKQTPSETSSHAVSVSGIIRRFFSNPDESDTTSEVFSEDIQSRPDNQLRNERDGNCSNRRSTLSAHSTARRAQRTSRFKFTPTVKPPRNNLKTLQVGKRLVNASNCLGHEQKGASSLCQAKSRKLSELCSSVRSLVFEMSDSDD